MMKILELSKDIYSSAVINEAIRAFQHLVRIKMHNTSCSWRLIFTKSKYDEVRTVYEFENYVIGLENQNGHH